MADENVETAPDTEVGAEKELTKEHMEAALKAASMEFHQVVRMPDGRTGSESTKGLGGGDNRGNEGGYCDNNGVLAFVDQDGSCRIMKSSAKAKQFLDALGYEPKNMWVPMSNGEEIVNNAFNDESTKKLDYLQERWEDTLAKPLI